MNEIDDIMQSAGYTHSSELQKILEKSSLPFGTLSPDDEEEDEFMMACKFDINACQLPYRRSIEQFRINELLDKIGIGTKGFFAVLSTLCKIIQDNTDKPIYTRNQILSVLDSCNNFPGCGQVIQILILQGIIVWFDHCDIDEGDRGYSEAESLCDWVHWQLIEVSTFYFMHFTKNENSKPLDDYLATLDVGKAWEERNKKKNPQISEDKISASEPDNINPQESILKNEPGQAISQPTPAPNDVKTYSYDINRVVAVFNFCDGSVFKDVSVLQFGECVAKANFREIYDKKGTIRSKLKRSISKLSYILDNEEWYRQAAQSIDVTPSGCSGANVSEDWLRQLNALK